MPASIVSNSIESAPQDCVPSIDRVFLRIPSGRVHFRSSVPPVVAGDIPVYLAHSGPGSSAGLIPLIEEIGRTRRTIAPDMLGNGDSDAPLSAVTRVDDYVAHAIEILDALGIDRVDFYGQHAGAHIACEFALRHPRRVRRLVLDGIALFDDSEKESMRVHYAPQVEPDEHGGHLAWAWHFVEGLTVHFPYYLRDPAHRLHTTAVPPAKVRQSLVVELLKSLPTYHLAYHAMFHHRPAERLPGLSHETLVMAVDGDPLARFVGTAAAFVPHATQAVVPRDRRAIVVREFLAPSPEIVDSLAGKAPDPGVAALCCR